MRPTTPLMESVLREMNAYTKGDHRENLTLNAIAGALGISIIQRIDGPMRGLIRRRLVERVHVWTETGARAYRVTDAGVRWCTYSDTSARMPG